MDFFRELGRGHLRLVHFEEFQDIFHEEDFPNRLAQLLFLELRHFGMRPRLPGHEAVLNRFPVGIDDGRRIGFQPERAEHRIVAHQDGRLQLERPVLEGHRFGFIQRPRIREGELAPAPAKRFAGGAQIARDGTGESVVAAFGDQRLRLLLDPAGRPRHPLRPCGIGAVAVGAGRNRMHQRKRRVRFPVFERPPHILRQRLDAELLRHRARRQTDFVEQGLDHPIRAIRRDKSPGAVRRIVHAAKAAPGGGGTGGGFLGQ